MPTAIGESSTSSETTILTLGLRYGVASNFDFYFRGSAFASRLRNTNNAGSEVKKESAIIDAWAGINYQFKPDDDTPAILSFAEFAIKEKLSIGRANFGSAMIGGIIYKAIDPVVLSLTAAYRFSRSRKGNNKNEKLGSLFLLKPSVAFAANDRVTLSTGVQWMRKMSGNIDGISQGSNHNTMDLVLGVGYAISVASVLDTTFKLNASGGEGSELRLNWTYRF